MSVMLTISRPIYTSGKQPVISLSKSSQEKASVKKKLTINISKRTNTTISVSIEKETISEDNCFNRYLKQKRCDIYELPDTRIQIMKGKFFYDQDTQRYAVDPKGWWVSEKLDGIRAIWTGKELMTRHGRKIHAPEWFYDEFPKNIALDGELYLGRNKFNVVQMTVMDHHKNKYLWEKIEYHVFDIPDATYLTFEEVQYILKNYLSTSCKYLKVIHQTQVKDLDQLLELQKILVSQGAEGTMLRKPGSSYRVGETSNLLKFKSQMDSNQMVHLLDDNAIITGYKYNYDILEDGMPIMRSILCKWEDKIKFPYDPEFSVSHHITKAEKRGDYQSRFPIGHKVKILYNQLFESQKPRFPRYGGYVLD